MSTNHHYLPQFYLNGFVDEGNVLYYCNKQFNTYRKVYPSGIYYQKGLNNIDFSPYGQIDLEKDFFQEKDNRYAMAFSDMRHKYSYDVNTMPDQTKADIIEFVLGLYWRVPGGLDHIVELIDTDGLLTGDLMLTNIVTQKTYSDEDVPQIIFDIKSKVENRKAFMTIFYEENVRKHNWTNLHKKFHIWETCKPMMIGDIPFVPIKSECRRGKILEEFVFPLDKNHLLIYTSDQLPFLEENLYQLIILSIIDGASEKIVCNNLEYLKTEMPFAINRIERLKRITQVPHINQLLPLFLKDICSKFSTFEDFQEFHTSLHYENASKAFFAQYRL